MKINILLPVLNEELRLEAGMKEALLFMEEHFKNRYQLTIVDNGSTDGTKNIAEAICAKEPSVSYIRLEQRGVGIALREGFKANTCEIVGYMDIDLSTDCRHLLEVDALLSGKESPDAVTGSRNMKGSKVIGRHAVRGITSRGLGFMVRALLQGNLNDYMCGFKFFKAEKLAELVAQCSENNGWFYCAELLIVAQWMGWKIVELPVTWTDDPVNSKVNGSIIKLIKSYMKEIGRLREKKKVFSLRPSK